MTPILRCSIAGALLRLRSRRRELEKRIGSLEGRERDLAARLETAFAPGEDHDAGARMVGELDEVRRALAELYEDWEEVAAALGD